MTLLAAPPKMIPQGACPSCERLQLFSLACQIQNLFTQLLCLNKINNHKKNVERKSLLYFTLCHVSK
jgi:hypothetical protein